MNTQGEPEKLEKSNDVFAMSNRDLVLWSAATGMDEWKGSLARAELTRRQTKTIDNFNRASTCLAWIMITAALVQIVVALIKR